MARGRGGAARGQGRSPIGRIPTTAVLSDRHEEIGPTDMPSDVADPSTRIDTERQPLLAVGAAPNDTHTGRPAHRNELGAQERHATEIVARHARLRLNFHDRLTVHGRGDLALCPYHHERRLSERATLTCDPPRASSASGVRGPHSATASRPDS